MPFFILLFLLFSKLSAQPLGNETDKLDDIVYSFKKTLIAKGMKLAKEEKVETEFFNSE